MLPHDELPCLLDEPVGSVELGDDEGSGAAECSSPHQPKRSSTETRGTGVQTTATPTSAVQPGGVQAGGVQPGELRNGAGQQPVGYKAVGYAAILSALLLPMAAAGAPQAAVSSGLTPFGPTRFGPSNSAPSSLALSSDVLASVAVNYGANGWINTANRAEVLAAYESAFGLGTFGIDMHWNGDTSLCLPGTTSAEWRQSVINRINFYRAMAGVPALISESTELSAMAQQAALSNAAETEQRIANGQGIQGVISHNLPSDRPCYSTLAGEAVARSNLFLGLTGPAAIDGYIVDPGLGNASAGHRNWLLHPPSQFVGIGGVPALGSGGYANDVLYVAGPGFWDPNPELRRADGAVAWPAAGFVPGQLVSPRWSFSLRGADFSGAAVRVESNGSQIQVEIDHRSEAGHNYAPFASLVWVPDSDQIATAPAVDTSYDVTITGVKVDGVAQTFKYSVTVIGDRPAAAIEAGAKGSTPVGASGSCGIGGYVVNSALERPCDDAGNPLPFGRCGDSDPRYWDASRVSVSDTFVQIFRLYCAGLGRFPDESGLEYWLDRASSGGLSLEQVAQHHLASPEWASLDINTEEKFVTELYRNVLGREPENEGFNFWVDRLNRGVSSRSEVLVLFSESTEHVARTKTRVL